MQPWSVDPSWSKTEKVTPKLLLKNQKPHHQQKSTKLHVFPNNTGKSKEQSGFSLASFVQFLLENTAVFLTVFHEQWFSYNAYREYKTSLLLKSKCCLANYRHWYFPRTLESEKVRKHENRLCSWKACLWCVNLFCSQLQKIPSLWA